MRKKKFQIVIEDGGMGSFLLPPNHPAYTHCLSTHNTRISLVGALAETWIDDDAKAAVRKLLTDWQPPAIDSKEVQDWIHQVLGFYRNCYNFTGHDENWLADKVTIDTIKDALQFADQHAGVHFIRQYYPDYKPTAEDFALAYWK